MEILLSIITITYANLSNLIATIESIDPDDQEIEHLVIDGGSKDGTVEYLKDLNRKNLTWVSEKDEGIYDAMNKGLSMAKGRYLIFMNAGDTFYRNTTIKEIKNILQKNEPDVVYGETMMVNLNFTPIGTRTVTTTRKLPDALTWKSMKKGMLVCHQSFIIRKSISPQYLMNNLSADIDWQIKGLKKSSKVIKFDSIISSYQIGGISQKKHFQSLTDRFKVLRDHYGTVSAIRSHLFFIRRAMIRKLGF